MKTTTTITRTFEIGDMVIFTGVPVLGDAYKRGDFLLIEERDPALFQFNTGSVVAGSTASAGGSADWLSSELDAGVLEYQGNVKVGV